MPQTDRHTCVCKRQTDRCVTGNITGKFHLTEESEPVTHNNRRCLYELREQSEIPTTTKRQRGRVSEK